MTINKLIQKVTVIKIKTYSFLLIFLFQIVTGALFVINPQKAYADANFNSDISKYFKLKIVAVQCGRRIARQLFQP